VCDWARREWGVGLGPKTKTEPPRLGFGKQNVGGGSVFGRGSLGGDGDVQLRGVGAVIGLVCRGKRVVCSPGYTLSPLSFFQPFPTS
jgi:hypothetical protein